MSVHDQSYSHHYESFVAGLTAPVIPHGSIFIDLSANDAAFALAACLRQWDHGSLKRRVAELWTSLSRTETYTHARNVIVALSARTALDLYLSSCQFPRGSLVLIGAINIPDISVVFRAHGLVPVPVDVDTETLAIRPALLDAALHQYGVLARGDAESSTAAPSAAVPPRVALVLTAHLFGRVTDVAPLVAICRRHAVPFVEDLAEALVDRSPVCFGHPDADLTLHSFGSTKYFTSLGGGIARVRCPRLFAEMSRRAEALPITPPAEFAKKVAKLAPLMALLNTTTLTSGTMRLCHALNIDYKTAAVAMLRGFPDRMMERIRAQPSAPQLALLARRLAAMQTPAGAAEFAASVRTFTAMKGYLAAAAADAEVVAGTPVHPASGADADAPLRFPVQATWLFPLAVRDVAATVDALSRAGVDVYRGATQLAAVPTPAPAETGGAPVAEPVNAQQVLAHLVYLPVHKRVPDATLHRIARAVAAATGPCVAAGARPVLVNAHGPLSRGPPAHAPLIAKL